jgi:hypothetical protein
MGDTTSMWTVGGDGERLHKEDPDAAMVPDSCKPKLNFRAEV